MGKRRSLEEQIADLEKKRESGILRIRARDKLHHARIALGKPSGKQDLVALDLLIDAIKDVAVMVGADDISIDFTLPAPVQANLTEEQELPVS